MNTKNKLTAFDGLMNSLTLTRDVYMESMLEDYLIRQGVDVERRLDAIRKNTTKLGKLASIVASVEAKKTER